MEKMLQQGHLSQVFYGWVYETIQSNKGLSVLIFVAAVTAFTNEALTALHARVRDRPLFWLRSRHVTLALHNLLAAIVHAVHLVFTFGIMLIVMTVDPALWTAVILGAAIGHFVCHFKFAWPSENITKIAW